LYADKEASDLSLRRKVFFCILNFRGLASYPALGNEVVGESATAFTKGLALKKKGSFEKAR
jgi:hypothetical protein